LIKNKNHECENTKEKLKDLIKENELYSLEAKKSRNYIESLQKEIKKFDEERLEMNFREESEIKQIKQIKQMKDEINSLTLGTDQIKIENSKLKNVKKQKEDYIQVLLTEKNLLHQEIRDLKVSLQINNDNNQIYNIANSNKNQNSII